MSFLKPSTAALVSAILMIGAFAPAWSASPGNDHITVAKANSSNAALNTAATILGAMEFPRVRPRTDAERNCKPGHLYSADNIVGDPRACIMGTFSGVSGISATVGGASMSAL
jgi:hypothetical protein